MPYIGNTIRAADDYRLIDDISSSFNGSTTSFALQVAGSAPVPFPKSPQQVLISVNGVIQEPDPTGASGFNLVGTNIVFSSAPTNGHAFFGIIYATADYLNSGGNFPSGSLGAPSITFIGDEDSGLYRKGAGSVGFVSDATEIANFDSNGITISSGNIIIPDSIIHNGDPNTKIRFPAADTFSVETSGSERLRINSSGHILIGTATSMTTRTGTSSFTPLFQISSDSEAAASISRFSNSTDSGRLSIQKGRGTIASKAIVQDGDNIGQILFSGWDGDTFTNCARIDAEVDGTPGDDDMPGRLVLATTADGGVHPQERMRITSAGKVGIGETSPAANLHIKEGDSGATPNGNRDTLFLENNGNSGLTIGTPNTNSGYIAFADPENDNPGQIIYRHADNSMSFFTAAGERLRIDSSGNVGIGTTSPDTKFHLSGDKPKLRIESTNTLEASAGTEEIARIEFEGTKGSNINVAASMRVRQDGTWSTSDDFFSPTAIEFYTQDQSGTEITTPRLTINSTGLVGIGTTSPSGSLHIDAASGVDGPVFESGGTGNTSHAFIVRDSASTQLLRVNNNGNIGIGTTAPATTLHLDASSGAVLRLQRTSSNATNKLEISHDGTDGTLESTNDMDFRTGGSVRMTLDSSGRLGIGTNSPDNLLHVSAGSCVAELESTTSSSSARLIIKSPNDTYGGLHFGDPEDSDRGRIRYYHNTDSMLFYTSADTHMTIHANGNITADDNADVLLGNPTDRNISSSDDNDPLHFESQRFLTGGMSVSNTKSRITVPTTGKYMAYAMMSGSSTSDNQTDGIQLKFLKNGSTLNSVQDFPIISFGENNEEYSIYITYMANLAASDYLEVCFDNVDAGTASLSRGYFGVYLVH